MCNDTDMYPQWRRCGYWQTVQAARDGVDFRAAKQSAIFSTAPCTWAREAARDSGAAHCIEACNAAPRRPVPVARHGPQGGGLLVSSFQLEVMLLPTIRVQAPDRA